MPYADIVNYEEMKFLHFQMIDLIATNKSILKETGTLVEAKKIIAWMECCEQGSIKAERKLFVEGLAMLENIKVRINLGMEERQRIENESPMNANNLSTRDEEYYNKASANSNNIVSDLTNLIEQKPQ